MAIKKKTLCPSCGKPVPGAVERTTHTVVNCHKCGSVDGASTLTGADRYLVFAKIPLAGSCSI